MTLAWRNLFHDNTRLGLSVGGVALAIMLILLLKGFLAGMNQQITSYLDHSPGSIIVAQKGVRNLLGATSLIPSSATEKIKGQAGVAEATPILSQFVILDLHGKKQPVYLIGYDPALGGGPWDIAKGRHVETERDLVFDRVLAGRHDLSIGDMVMIMGNEFTIVGLSDGTTSWMTSFLFIQKRAAEDLLRLPGASSFFLVTPSMEAEKETIRDNLSALDVEASLKSEMIANDLKLFAKVFSGPLRLMVGIAFLVGTMIIGLVIYTATIEREREYGALKAIGASNRALYQVVMIQALVASLGGAAAGIGLANLAGKLIMTARPQFLIVFARLDVAAALVAGLGMALAAAYFPARVVAGLEPAKVFRK